MSHFGRAGPPDIRDTYSLLVLNITFRTTADELYPFFDRYGKVVDIFIPRDRRTGDSRGFAFVRYKYVEEAQKAVDRLDGMTIDGRQIAVQFAKYGRNDEKIYGADRSYGRITSALRRSRSRSPRRPRYHDDIRGRDYEPRYRSRSRERDDIRGRDYEPRYRSRSRERERDRHTRGSRDGYARDRYYEERARDGYVRYERVRPPRERDPYSYDRERDRTSREYYEPERSRDRHERDRYGGAPAPNQREREARIPSSRRNISPQAARVSPSQHREAVRRSPVDDDHTPYERTRKSRSRERRSPSSVRSPSRGVGGKDLSPVPRSPLPSNNGVDGQSPYNTDPDEA